MYDIEISPAADRDLARLNKKISRPERSRLITSIDRLEQNPRPDGARKTVGTSGIYRIRVGDFRVIYEIDDPNMLVILLHVSRRSESTYK